MLAWVGETLKTSKKIIVYTDGGCRCHIKNGSISPTDKSAYAIYLEYGKHSKLMGEGFYGKTNNEMELMAVYQALVSITKKDIPVVIHSDSAYVVNCFNEVWWKKWKLNGWKKKGGLANAELWKKTIEEYLKFDSVEFVKVKGHDGVEYNELVDKHLNEIMDQMEDVSV